MYVVIRGAEWSVEQSHARGSESMPVTPHKCSVVVVVVVAGPPHTVDPTVLIPTTTAAGGLKSSLY